MSEKPKNALMLSYFAKQRRKESTEINEQETDISKATCGTLIRSRLSVTQKRTNRFRFT